MADQSMYASNPGLYGVSPCPDLAEDSGVHGHAIHFAGVLFPRGCRVRGIRLASPISRPKTLKFMLLVPLRSGCCRWGA